MFNQNLVGVALLTRVSPIDSCLRERHCQCQWHDERSAAKMLDKRIQVRSMRLIKLDFPIFTTQRVEIRPAFTWFDSVVRRYRLHQSRVRARGRTKSADKESTSLQLHPIVSNEDRPIMLPFTRDKRE